MTELPPPTPGSAAPTTMSIGPSFRQGWVERKWAARGIGAIAYLIPFAASVAAAFALSEALPAAPNLPVGLVRWLGVAMISTVVLVLVEKQTRRLMPLRTLLGLTLAFPDKAPSRFKIAIRTGTTTQLRARLDEARAGRLGDTPSEAAERLLELVGMLSQHDRLTRGHSERVRAYSHMIGAEMGLSERELDRLRWAGLLHDVGKLAIDPEILNKPGKLTADEFEIVKTHPMEGKALVEPLAEWLGDAARAVWEHHERYDGGGYPQGLAGSEISQAARIVSVADVFDVITSVRSYKAATSARAAREELARCAGTQFDPVVVRAFLALSMGQVRKTVGPLSWCAQLAFLPGAVAAHAGPALATVAVVTAGAAAGTVGMVADSGPLIADSVEYLATVDEVEPLPTSVPTGGVDAGSSDAGAAPRDAVVSDDGDPDAATIGGAPTTSQPGAGRSATTSSSTTLTTDLVTTTILATNTSPTTAVATTAATTTTTTTVPETTTTTTTTLPNAIGGQDLFLLGVGTQDQSSRSILPLGTSRPADVDLPNYDTDRDAAPGLLIQKDSAGVNGTDPTKVQRWQIGFATSTVIDTEITAQLEVAAKDFGRKDIRVQAQLMKCGASGCVSLGVADRTVMNAERFKKANFDFGHVTTVLGLGETFELRIAILADSEDDAWLAFGTQLLDSRIRLE